MLASLFEPPLVFAGWAFAIWRDHFNFLTDSPALWTSYSLISSAACEV
jgi:hypothetical protein